MIDEGIYLTRVDVGADWPEFVILTRDAQDETGELSQVVEVWADAPRMSPEELGPGVTWLPRDLESEGLLGRYSLESARKFFRTVPDTAREVVRAPCR